MDRQTYLTFIFMVSGLVLAGGTHAEGFATYASGDLGLALLDDAKTRYSELPGTELETGYHDDITFSGAVGLTRGHYRTELEIAYQKNVLENLRAADGGVDPAAADLAGNTAHLSGLVNAYYDFTPGRMLRPYVTAGIGLANIDTRIDIIGFDELSFNADDIVLTYHLGAGMGLVLSDHVTVDIRYRYLTGQDPEFGTRASSFLSHNITAGIRVSF